MCKWPLSAVFQPVSEEGWASHHDPDGQFCMFVLPRQIPPPRRNTPISDGYGRRWTLPQPIRARHPARRGRARTAGPLLHLKQPPATLCWVFSISAWALLLTRDPAMITWRRPTRATSPRFHPAATLITARFTLIMVIRVSSVSILMLVCHPQFHLQAKEETYLHVLSLFWTKGRSHASHIKCHITPLTAPTKQYLPLCTLHTHTKVYWMDLSHHIRNICPSALHRLDNV